MVKIDYVKLIISLLITQFIGIIGSFFTTNSIDLWYAQLNQPTFNPPNWVFGPTWFFLYLLMGISLYIVWNKGFTKNKKAISIFGIQLFFNMAWSILFFGFKSIKLAFLDIVLLLIGILFTIIYFYRISKTASYLLVPYLLWVSFAAVLNFSFILLN